MSTEQLKGQRTWNDNSYVKLLVWGIYSEKLLLPLFVMFTAFFCCSQLALVSARSFSNLKITKLWLFFVITFLGNFLAKEVREQYAWECPSFRLVANTQYSLQVCFLFREHCLLIVVVWKAYVPILSCKPTYLTKLCHPQSYFSPPPAPPK